jgi:hypothetical protein
MSTGGGRGPDWAISRARRQCIVLRSNRADGRTFTETFPILRVGVAERLGDDARVDERGDLALG